MTRFEKLSWYTVVLCVLSAIGFFVGGSLINILVTAAIIMILVINGFVPLLYRKQEPFDERDRIILRTSQMTGHCILWLFFVLVSFGIWGWYHSQGKTNISIGTFPRMVVIGIIIIYTIQSVTAIILYRRSVVHGES